MKNKIRSIGLGKVQYNTSASAIHASKGCSVEDVEVVLSERVSRKKASSEWPFSALQSLEGLPEEKALEHELISENRDVQSVEEYESSLNQVLPFYEVLEKKGLTRFVKEMNPEVSEVNHHLAHARCAQFFSPFESAVIWVLDGAGSQGQGRCEYDSVFLLDQGALQRGPTKTTAFYQAKDGHWLSDSIGILYETAALYIFGSNQAAGKVMGLASLGSKIEVDSARTFIEQLDWSKSYKKGLSKNDWESCPHMKLYQDIAATIQGFFEDYCLSRIKEIAGEFKEYKSLIMVGGCALNCTTNQKIKDLGLFEETYIPPCPGDGGISLGCAYHNLIESGHIKGSPFSYEFQNSFFGPKTSVPSKNNILEIFEKFQVQKINSYKKVYEILGAHEIVAWFQGRSEIGPRALGGRSLLASVENEGLKDYLNNHVKFREAFRPYGCSVIHEKASLYFDVNQNFQNPFMSYATRVRFKHRDLLKQVSHIDGTSRMQTVTRSQNERLYELLSGWGDFSGHPILLNTSLNIMGEPIVETPEDALRFLEHSPVQHLVIGDYLVSK